MVISLNTWGDFDRQFWHDNPLLTTVKLIVKLEHKIASYLYETKSKDNAVNYIQIFNYPSVSDCATLSRVKYVSPSNHLQRKHSPSTSLETFALKKKKRTLNLKNLHTQTLCSLAKTPDNWKNCWRGKSCASLGEKSLL